MEDLSQTQEYKKAYEQADRLCRERPDMIDQLIPSENEPPAIRQAFEDRISDFKIEQDSMGNMSHRDLFKKYGLRLQKFDQTPARDRGYSRE